MVTDMGVSNQIRITGGKAGCLSTCLIPGLLPEHPSELYHLLSERPVQFCILLVHCAVDRRGKHRIFDHSCEYGYPTILLPANFAKSYPTIPRFLRPNHPASAFIDLTIVPLLG